MILNPQQLKINGVFFLNKFLDLGEQKPCFIHSEWHSSNKKACFKITVTKRRELLGEIFDHTMETRTYVCCGSMC